MILNFSTYFFSKTFQLGQFTAELSMYNGGSDKDKLLIHVNGTTNLKSFGNQMFIKFKTLGAGIDKGFTLNISFGSRTNC